MPQPLVSVTVFYPGPTGTRPQDLNEPSYFDVVIASAPFSGARFDGWCLDPGLNLLVNNTTRSLAFSADLYSSYELNILAAGIPSLGNPNGFLSNLDSINWLINYFDGTNTGVVGNVSYLPQDVELLDGTISENIARFGAIDADKVVAAAQGAGVHEMILRLPEGYDTRLIGNVLSGGQRQRIGMARALYGDPQVIVLDEPNSNLDQDGDAALAKILADLKRAGRTVMVVTHRSNLLGQADKILLLAEGQIAVYGNRDKVLATLQQAATRAPASVASRPVVVAQSGPQPE